MALCDSCKRHEIIALCYSAPLSPLNPPVLFRPPIILPNMPHTHLAVLFIDDSSLPFLFRIHSQQRSFGTSGPNGLISTVYSCGLFYNDSQKTQRGLCEQESFSYSHQQDPVLCTLLCFSLESSPVSLPSLPPPTTSGCLLSTYFPSQADKTLSMMFLLTGVPTPCHLASLRLLGPLHCFLLYLSLTLILSYDSQS